MRNTERQNMRVGRVERQKKTRQEIWIDSERQMHEIRIDTKR